LLSNFVGFYRVQEDRYKFSEQLFFNQNWKKTTAETEADVDAKTRIYEEYQKLVMNWAWNSRRTPILPFVHGTSFPIACAICETGFAALSSLDDGWYGKGIYFTSYISYALEYTASKNQPSIVVSWVIPGNVYPVTRKCHGEAIQPGYSSHFVLTDSSGQIVTAQTPPPYYDELVVSQEPQILPAFIIKLQVEQKKFDERLLTTNSLNTNPKTKDNDDDLF